MENGGVAFAAGVLHSLCSPAFRNLADGREQAACIGGLCGGVVGHAGGGSLRASGPVSCVVSGRTVDGGQGDTFHAAAVRADYVGQLVLYGRGIWLGAELAPAGRLPVVDGGDWAVSHCAVRDVEPQPATEPQPAGGSGDERPSGRKGTGGSSIGISVGGSP